MKEEGELESSRVKEAALDDKLGIELRSIVEQIQVQEQAKHNLSTYQDNFDEYIEVAIYQSTQSTNI